MRKPIAIATADWHLHKFRNFDDRGSRLMWSLRAAKEIMGVAHKLNVPLLFAGDLLHTPKDIENETNKEIQELFRHMYCNMYAISGNHDMSEKNSLDHRSPSHLDAIYGKLTKLSGLEHGLDTSEFVIWGIDYMNNDLDLRKAIDNIKVQAKRWKDKPKILLLHSDCPGAQTPEGFKIGETEHIPTNLDKFFRDWDFVLFGHIHKAQQLSKKCFMLGCPIQQDLGNEGMQLGYWILYNNLEWDFVLMDNYPKFIRLKKGEVAPENTTDYYIPYNEVLADENVQVGEFDINYSKSKLAKRYLALRQIKNKTKRRALIKILNESE